jgi:hypothetical protein
MQFDALLDLWVTTATTFLVLLFARALLHKAADLGRFTGFLGNYNVLPPAGLTIAAYGLITLEGLIVLLLVTPQLNQLGAALAIGVLFLYAAVIALNVARGHREIECGCGGPAMLLSYSLVLRNIAVATIALPLLLGGDSPISTTDTAVAVACGAILYLFYVVAEQLLANVNQADLQGSFQ